MTLLSVPGCKANYAIKPTPEQALRSNRAILPARLIAALDLPMENGVPSKQVVSQRIRNRILEYLEMVESYDRDPPPWDLNETLNQWEDWVPSLPELGYFEAPVYTPSETLVLVEVARKWEKFCSVTPSEIVDEAADLKRPEWKLFRAAAEVALGVLRERGLLSEEAEV